MDNICQIHNEPALFSEQNAQEQMVLFCKICMEQKFKYQNIDDIEHLQKEALQQLELKQAQKKFDYQLMQQSSYKQNEFCGAIAFNKDTTIVIAGCVKLIKIFEFKDDKLQEVQQLKSHKLDVSCLNFMKKSNSFISGSEDSTMIIWEQIKNNMWQSTQILKGHKYHINCIAMNKNDDMLISGSFDCTIKFWQQQNNIWYSYQSIDFQSIIQSISLSDNEDKLIVSLKDQQIIVMQFQDREWMIKQKIPVEQYGCRLCFINQNQFVFQPLKGQHLQIFDSIQKNKLFKNDYNCNI